MLAANTLASVAALEVFRLETLWNTIPYTLVDGLHPHH